MNLQEIEHHVGQMRSINLYILENVSLQNRIDLKFLSSRLQWEQIFPCLLKNYDILEIQKRRIFTYENIYFDSDSFQLYHDHHNGYVNRVKVRSRKYVETNNCFFEVKKKEHIERTQKHRETTTDLVRELNADQLLFIQSLYRKKIQPLSPVLENHFNRMTFANKSLTERVTIDFNVQFSDQDKHCILDDLFIIEIKKDKNHHQSLIEKRIKELNMRPQGFSKYVYGMASLKSNLKKNNFLPLIKKVNHLRNGSR